MSRFQLRLAKMDFKIFWKVRHQCLREYCNAIEMLQYFSDAMLVSDPYLICDCIIDRYVGFIKMTDEIFEKARDIIEYALDELRYYPEEYRGDLFIGQD